MLGILLRYANRKLVCRDAPHDLPCAGREDIPLLLFCTLFLSRSVFNTHARLTLHNQFDPVDPCLLSQIPNIEDAGSP